jgi:hypothetical protein
VKKKNRYFNQKAQGILEFKNKQDHGSTKLSQIPDAVIEERRVFLNAKIINYFLASGSHGRPFIPIFEMGTFW